jgi:nucleoside-diphosphate-sugar epimerase
MRVFVLGGTGFIGTAVVGKFVQRGGSVIGPLMLPYTS